MPSTSVGISSMIRRTFNKLSAVNLKKVDISNFLKSTEALKIFMLRVASERKSKIQHTVT